ncbi:SDR family oxidoreductase [Umezawaea endophytica]|uniref:SDR family oxidoreductase n=1 Tax=Umezawaea endophytica TaxID=1654476 RepID=A0A9X3A4L7_9PSEU|nr:SDR family oxidoreductase [Umezawaea endophytica]MCS7482954.1 SDR family oxidoreductase [Umezawaea endophytica]
MIIVTGATGQLGRLVVEGLLAAVPADQVGVSVRDSTKAEALAERGVRVRQGGFADPASLRHAFEGASRVLVISSNSAGDSAVRHHRNAIDAAMAVGAGRVVYTSQMAAGPDSAFAPMLDHAATEIALQESGVPFTSLRNGFYAASAIQFLGRGLASGSLPLPADGPVSWTAHEDLARAAVIALTEEGRLDGITPPLTSSQALTFHDLAAIATEVTGRDVSRTVISDDEFKRNGLAHGLPEAQVDMGLGLFAACRAGEFSVVDPTLEELLGRRPRTFREVFTESQAV